MPKVKLAPYIEEIHGILYDMVFKKSPQGEMIVTKKPDMSKVKWSKAQKALMNPKLRARYKLKAKKQGRRAWAWNLALSGCLEGKGLHGKR